MITFQDVCVRYSDKDVLDRVTFQIKKGDFIFVFGKSGSGKTALLQSLLGTKSLSSGSILIDGHSVGELTREEWKTFFASASILLEKTVLAQERTCEENLKLSGARESEIQVMLHFLSLEAATARKVKTLSAGEIRCLELGLGMLRRPKLFLLDCPFRFLDQEQGEKMLRYFLSLQKQGVTILITGSEPWVLKTCLDEASVRALLLGDATLVDMKKIPLPASYAHS